MRNINMWTMSQHAHEDGCKPHNSCFYWSYITLDGSKLMKTWMRDQSVQQFFLLFIGDCIPNLRDKPGKVTLCPQQLICRFYFLFQTACHQGTKAKPIPKRQCLEWGGIVSMSCLPLCMHIAFIASKSQLSLPDWAISAYQLSLHMHEHIAGYSKLYTQSRSLHETWSKWLW